MRMTHLNVLIDRFHVTLNHGTNLSPLTIPAKTKRYIQVKSFGIVYKRTIDEGDRMDRKQVIGEA